MNDTASENTIPDDLLAILRCPLTRSRLRREGNFLVAEKGALRYPIREGVPVMLPEEARLPPDVASLDEFKEKYRSELAE